MDYALQIRAASKPEAEEAIIDAMEGHAGSASVNWEPAKDALGALLDELEDNPNLDVIVTVAGSVNHEGDVVRHVNFAFTATMTDR
jgi:hypothetical protein